MKYEQLGSLLITDDDGDNLGFIVKDKEGHYIFRVSGERMYFTCRQLREVAEKLSDMNQK